MQLLLLLPRKMSLTTERQQQQIAASPWNLQTRAGGRTRWRGACEMETFYLIFHFSSCYCCCALCFHVCRKTRTKDTAFLFCVSFICADTHSIALGWRIVFFANVSVIGVYGQKKEKSEPLFRKGHVCHQQIGDV